MPLSTIAYVGRHGHLPRETYSTSSCGRLLRGLQLVSCGRRLPVTTELRVTQRGVTGSAGGLLARLPVAPACSSNPNQNLVATRPQRLQPRWTPVAGSGQPPHSVAGTGSSWRRHPGRRSLNPTALSRLSFATSTSTSFGPFSLSSSNTGSCMIAARTRRLSLSSSVMASAYSAYHGASNGSQFTITAMGRWSCLNKTLPPADKIKALHVYDFDNTLFRTPLPNPALWNGPTIGLLATQEAFNNGGWWHDNRILAATGQGIEVEEPRGWDGWWNEKIVELVRLTIKQPDALCVMLTGRSEKGFAELVKRMLASKGLECDMVSLKPQVSPTNQRFQNTMHFKQLFLNSLMETYKNATEIRVYEDRPKHTKGFREFFAEYNRRQTESPTRGPLDAEVIQVADGAAILDPVIEVAEVQHMINTHNEAIATQPMHLRQNRLQIKKTVFFTSYMIGNDDSKKLVKFAQIPADIPGHDLKFHANHILICPRPCPASILEKVGGMGSKMLWEVTGTACYNNSVWAASVRPVPSSAVYHTDNPVPLIVLALRKGARPIDAGKITQWQPVPSGQSFVFETTVGEKVILRVEEEDPREDEYESLFANKSSKRKHAGDDEWASKNTHGQYGGRNESQGYHTGGRGGGRGRGNRGNRGFHNTARGGGRGGGRGKGPGHHYRSLDDVDPKPQQGGYGQQVDYDDSYPPLGQQQGKGRGSRGRGGRGGRGAGRPGAGQAPDMTDMQNLY